MRGSVNPSSQDRRKPDELASAGSLPIVVHAPPESARPAAALAARGLADSVLETDDWRLPAIATYLKCGYLPEPREPIDHDRWEKVRNALRPGTLQWSSL